MKYKKQIHCKYCGRFFIPDPRCKNPKSCSRKQCLKMRKKGSQQKWIKSNPDYFKGRYEDYLIEWRKRNPHYQKELRRKKKDEIQDEIPPGKPIKTIRLVVPEKWVKDEIQDSILIANRCGCGYYIDGRVMQDTRRDVSL